MLDALKNPGGRYDPIFGREDLTLSMDPSWGTFNNTMYNSLNASQGATNRGLGYMDQLMRAQAPQADYSMLSPYVNGSQNAMSQLMGLAQGGGWNQGYANQMMGGQGMQALNAASMNPSAVNNPLLAGAQGGMGMDTLRQLALTGGRNDINPQLDAIKTSGMQTLEDTLAQIREQYGAMGLGAGSDISDALGRGASRGIADIIKQQSELAAGLDTQAQNRRLSAGGTEQSALSQLLSSVGQLNLGSSGQAIQAGSGIQDSLSSLMSLWGQGADRSMSATANAGGLANSAMGTYGNLQLGNAGLQGQHLGNLMGGAGQYMQGGAGLASAAASLTPGLGAYAQESSRMQEANLSRWYNEVLRQAQGPPMLQNAMGYATNFPPVQQPYQQGSSGWPSAIGAIGGGLMASMPYWAPMLSDRNAKEAIEPVEGNVLEMVKDLPISTWRYKGDPVRHIGPMAQDFQEKFGVGDGRTIHLIDVMGVLMQSMKELAHAQA